LKCSADPRGTLERLQGKQGVIAALIEGRVDLFEATAKFRILSEDTTCNSEQLCRSVIGWVHLALCDRPERAEAVTGALEQELDLYLSRHAAGRRTAFN
jgi:hypothetical protein